MFGHEDNQSLNPGMVDQLEKSTANKHGNWSKLRVCKGYNV